ncbi:MAG TPA: glutamate-1-semialdehyde 2,1-aminomutase [Roseiflexaceae bacterium]|nr:glutamate-1-semialdehyde 2,1-aminomutase [Roseiflexaceae bacterium]HMP38884.1 glutamate-1-semialdehyde 2,1-aminomutase [Roseiflexaceae bacterium]
MTSTQRSEALFAEARQLIPGGVNSPVRAFRGVGGTPRFIARGEGPFLVDADGQRYIDYVLSWGPLILGHADAEVVAAICEQAARGTTYGAPTELESELARLVIDMMPAVEMVRFVSSGTEAAMSALRLARAYTGRDKIIKFAGCYHGHYDGLLVQAGSGVATLGLPDSPGVPAAVAAGTLTAPYNDLDAVEVLLRANAGQVAAIAIEPVVGNMGFVAPRDGFLAGLRRLADDHGALLVFDEVMTGFRVAPGGAQERFGISPDLTCMGKVIGGGLPAAAYGGRRQIMEMVAPVGPMYQAGTLSGNPLAMAAGIVTLRRIREPGVFAQLEQSAAALCAGLTQAAAAADIPLRAAYAGSMWGFFFTADEVFDYTSAKTADTARYGRFFHAMLERGVYLAPSQFEAAFVSTRHDAAIIRQTLDAAAEALVAAR